MTLFVRQITPEERTKLLEMEKEGGDIRKRVQIILLSGQRQQVQDIAAAVKLHAINVRKWITRFNQRGPGGLRERQSPGRPRVFSDQQRREIAGIARCMSCPTLSKVRQAAIDQGLVEEISLESVRNFLHVQGIELGK